MAEHTSTFDTDTDDGWPAVYCTCGWTTGSVPDMEIAADSWADHLVDVVTAQLGAERDLARAAAAELASFITSELDPDPAPWPSYVTDGAQMRLMAELEAQARG